jgi:hypothetical protein
LLPDLMDRADIGVVQGRCSLGFALETGQRLGSRATSEGRNFRATKRCSRVSSAL